MADALYNAPASDYTPPMPKDPYNFRFDSDLMARMTTHAAREGRSRNALIERMMRAYDADPRIQELVRIYVETEPAPKS